MFNKRSTPAPFYLFTPLAISIAAGLAPAYGEEPIDIIEIHSQQINNSERLGSAEQLLREQGVDFSAAGGMSGLPVLNGMMGDRIKVLIDGAEITSACANHMNPPLSYISANQIQSLNVLAGISPVSVAGDNIAGVISVDAIDPQYTDNTQLGWLSGYVAAQYRSVDQGKSVGIGARMASQNVSLDYQGAYDDADSYQDGNGDKVLDTLYRAQNHVLTAAIRDEKQQLAIKLTHQSIGFQGFPNQYMDMTSNKSYGVTAQYLRPLEDGEFKGQVNWHNVKHEMGFFSAEKTGMMPMSTEADDYSYLLHWQFDLPQGQTLLLGQEYYVHRIEDWWPAIEGSAMMGPNDYMNIHDGKRERIAGFAELQQQLNSKWLLTGGVRIEHVTTETGEVQGYQDMTSDSGMDMNMGMSDVNSQAAKEFNTLSRKQNDNLVDVTLLSRYQLSPTEQVELGIARKNRAPNLYERYSWGQSTMATTMIGWFGDGNGYIGNPQLKPETAHTVSASYRVFGADKKWNLSANIWYTSVHNYIDAQVLSSFNKAGAAGGQRNILQFTNLDATLYGHNLQASVLLADNDVSGTWQLKGKLSTTYGERDEGEEALYQIKPLQTDITLEQKKGIWQNSITWQWVANKNRVDSRRLENTTEGYHLLNISSRAAWDDVTVSFAVQNLLDEYYQMPLGGVNVAQYKTDSSQGFQPLAASGRSVNIGLNYAF